VRKDAAARLVTEMAPGNSFSLDFNEVAQTGLQCAVTRHLLPITRYE